MEFDKGYVSPYMVTIRKEWKRFSTTLHSITENKINT
jgi:hypothetical protein